MTSSTGRDSRGAALLALLMALAVALAVALATPFAGAGQEPAPPVIGRVAVEVDGRPAAGALRDIVPIKPGEAYSPVSVDQAVRQIFQVGLFSDIRVLKSGQEKVDLTFVLTRNLTVRKIKVKGARVRTSRLREAMETVRAGGVFNEDKLPKAVDELKEALRSAGYFGAAVEASVLRRTAEPRVDIVFTVSGAKRFRVRGVDLRGTEVVPRGEVFKRMKTKPPKFYEPSVLDRDIQTLSAYYANLGYRRVEIQLAEEKFDEAAGTVLLELGIEPHEKISIVTNGAKIPAKLLAPIWEERIFEEWGLSEGEVRVLSYLRKKGYLFATVKSRIERPENEIRVIYDIDPGRTYRIDKVSFEGLSAFTPQRLKEELVVSENVLFFALLSYDRLFALPSEIEYFYQTNGFPDVRVKLDLRRAREKGVDAVYIVEEGPQRKIASITVNGARLFPVKDILAGTLASSGGPYFPPAIQRDIGIIESFYLNHGVRGTRVTSRAAPQTGGLTAITYDIEEGRPVVIRNILITGNRTTRPRVVGREIQVRVGEPADASKIQDSKRRLERLGIFSDVRTDEVMTGEGGEILVVAVQEGEANYAGVGIGLESKNPVPTSGPNEIRPRATGEYIRSNVLGLAAQLSVIGQTSLVEKRAIVSWSQPYLFGITLQPALLGWIEQENRTSFGFDRRGVSFNLSRPLGRNVFLLGTLSLSRTKLTFIDFAPSDVDRRLQPYASALASVSLILDRRDDSFNPTRGWFFSVVAQGAKPIFGTESDYWKTFFKFQRLWPIVSQVNVTMTARIGLSQGKIAVPERFFAGGSNSFRGQQFDYLGPKDPDTGKPVGGKALFLLNVEVPFPIFASFKDLSGVVFGDVGNVYPEIRDFRLRDLETAAGLGLRYRTPLGPVRIELAWRLGAPERRGRPLFFITIGNVF